MCVAVQMNFGSDEFTGHIEKTTGHQEEMVFSGYSHDFDGVFSLAQPL